MSRAVLAPFEAYQKARVTFVQTVAELAQRPQNIEALQSAGKFLLNFINRDSIAIEHQPNLFLKCSRLN